MWRTSLPYQLTNTERLPATWSGLATYRDVNFSPPPIHLRQSRCLAATTPHLLFAGHYCDIKKPPKGQTSKRKLLTNIK